jgi:hypothetical protein
MQRRARSDTARVCCTNTCAGIYLHLQVKYERVPRRILNQHVGERVQEYATNSGRDQFMVHTGARGARLGERK